MTTSITRDDVDSLPGRARLRYYLAILTLGLLASGGVFSRPASRLMLVLLGLYTFTSLRAEHAYYVEAARRGCAPAPRFRHDVFGIRFLLRTAAELKRNRLLAYLQGLLEGSGHTFFHGVAGTIPGGGAGGGFTTDEPENVKAVLGTRFEDWEIPRARIRGFLPVLGTHSIFTTNGAEWQHSRAILRPAFVRDQISDLACVDGHVRKLVARIPRDGRPFDLQALFSMMTTDSISDFMLGQSTDLLGSAPEESHRFGRCFDESMQKIAMRVRLGWMAELRRDAELEEYSRFMRGFVRRFVEEVRRRVEGQEARGDERGYVFLDELLRSGEEDEVICDHLLSIFTAGRDTTTSILSYLFLELSIRPDIVSAIRQEIIDAVGEDINATPTWEQLRNMKYLNYVIKEAARLNPPVATNQREAVRDTVLPRGGGRDGRQPVLVRKGMSVRYSPWTMHRRKDLFGEDAEEFRPERWEGLRVTHEYLPFNAGPRICIGQQFALTQMALITFRLLQAFKAITRRDDRPPVQKLGVNLSLLHGCLVSVIPA
ncbi:cytochrome P450 52E2 [Xylaria sp. CBS 124048]|nr:cytochrome P450 52E2 [Xylaria sp. CBS 124048]